MKKRFKRILALVMAIMLCVSWSIVANATGTANEEAYVVYEYDTIVRYRTMNTTELKAEGMTTEDIEYIKSTALEEELLFRKTRSIEELKNYYGYSEDEVVLLMEYDGSRIEDNPNLRALTAQLTISEPDVLYATSNSVGIEVSWAWDKMPALTLTDALAISWVGTYGSDNGNLRIDIDECTHYVTYTGITTTTFERGIVQEDLLYGAVGEFGMMHGTYDWASSGVATLFWDTVTGSAEMTSVDFKFLYGHSVLNLGPSFSWPISAGVSPSIGTNEADVRNGYVDISSGVWVDN